MRLYELAAQQLNMDVEQVRQVYLMTAMGYSQKEISAGLQCDNNLIGTIQTALGDASETLGVDEMTKRSLTGYKLVNDMVNDELLELYQDQKADYQAARQRLTAHPDGRAVRKVAVRDMVGTLNAIEALAAKRMTAEIGIHRVREASLKKPQALPGAAGGDFDPSQLAEAIDVEFVEV